MKYTAKKIAALKAAGSFAPLAVATAYDAITGRFAEAAGAPVVLVGDSLGNTALGFESTIPVTMEMMLHHTAAVRRGVKNALVVADMPFMSYHASRAEAVVNAGRFLQVAGADAVKLEGGVLRAELIREIVGNGIPVMAHIGLLPQSLKVAGFATKGGSEAEAEALRADIAAVVEAGAFCVVLECVRAELAAELSALSPVPTIGIGSGAGCDGQVLVMADLLGLTEGAPKFVRRFANLGELAVGAVRDYVEAVRAREYPGVEHSYN
jgi:3-methyl-2-oxobutanoate hydroxymethyltransferase